MAQRLSHYNTDCQECMISINQDEPIWFGGDGEKLCRNCALGQNRVCPECNGGKRPTFEVCFDCKQKARGREGFRPTTFTG